jgi:hypothetical protein
MKFIKEHKYLILLIFLASIIIMLPAFINPYYFKGHDTYYHFANVFAIKDLSVFEYLNLKIVPEAAYNLAYGSKIFYTSIPHVFIAFLIKIGIDIYTSFKLYHVLVLFLSGLSMFLFMIKVNKDKTIAFLASLIYITFPYRIANIYIRESLAESLIFMSMPLVLLGLYSLINGNKKDFYIYFIIGTVLSVYSHLILSIYLSLFGLLYLCLNFKKTKQEIKHLLKASFIILCLIMPFIGPLIEHRFFTKYVVFESGMMVNSSRIINYLLNPIDLLVGIDIQKDIYYFIPSIVILLLLVLIYRVFKKEIKIDNYIKYATLTLLITIFLQINHFIWNIMPESLTLIQFPWRLQVFMIFAVSYLASISITNYKNKYNILIIFIILIIFAKMVPVEYAFVNRDIKEEIKEDISAYAMGWNYEYLPLKAYNNIEYIKTKEQVFNDECKIIKKEYKYLSFIMSDNCDELPLYYYSGYEIKVNDKKVDYSESDNGLIKINAKDSDKVVAIYKGSIIDKASSIIFILSLGIFIYVIKKTD